jgi:hypothetical protein
MAAVRPAIIALALGVVLLVAVLAAGAWQMRRFDHDLHTLQASGGSSSRLDRALHSLAALSTQTANVRDSSLRLEFQLPLQAYLTQALVAVETGNLDCVKAKRLWQDYVNNTLIPEVNKPKNRRQKMALRRDDPDYHATLLNAFTVAC